jgi:hypothetical protein
MLNEYIKGTLPSVPFLKEDHERVPLTFKRAANGPIDSYGNPTGGSAVLILAHLYLKVSSEAFPNPAQGQQDKVYLGHALDPKILPVWVVPGTSGTCTIGGRSHDFRLLSIDRTAMPAYAENIGERLEIVIFSASKSF